MEKLMNFLVLTLLVISEISLCGAVYVDKGYPYKSGPLSVTEIHISKKENGSPLNSIVLFPATPGNYSVYFFITGFNGVIFSAAYTDYLSRVATHGFIVISTDVDPVVVEYDGERNEADNNNLGIHFGDLFLNQLNWMKSNLQAVFNTMSPGVTIAWQNIAAGSHSAGADSTTYIAQHHPGLFKAVVLQGPFASNFYAALNFSLPVLMIQSEFGTQHKGHNPPCIFKEFGYEHIWQLWPQAPRVKMEAKGFGHCGILNYALWEACYKSQICVTTQNVTSLPFYINFNQGITNAFLNTYVNDYDVHLPYVTNQTLLPNFIDKLMVDV